MIRSRRQTTEVVWTRKRSIQADAPETIRIRRNKGDWQEVASPADLPADVRELVDDFFSGKVPVEDFALEDAATLLPPRRKPESRRRRVRATESPETLTLEYLWFEGCTVVAAVIAALAALYYGIEAIEGHARALPVWGGWLSVLFSATMTYFGLVTLLNRTTITIADGLLTVRHGPLPWPGSRAIPLDDIRQLYCSVYRAGKHGLRWRLSAHTDGEGAVQLLDHIRSKDEAVSLERAIERHLGIPDWPRFGD